MTVRNFVFASLVIVCGLGVSAAYAQTHGDSKEIRSTLFKRVMADFGELRECVEREEGGLRAAEENATVEEMDLNRDGVPEYEVGVSSPCACGMVNCSIYVYRRSPAGYELILDDAAGLGIELLRTSSNGYSDLQVNARDTAATEARTIFKFDGKRYRDAGTKIVHHETGESKPSHRRVQFKRGASSATLSGKVSIAMPDTFLLGARAGQVMTVQLTSARKSVRFLVMSPSTRSLVADNARNWSGTLTETGDYTIIVDGDAAGGTYSMTVSIR